MGEMELVARCIASALEVLAAACSPAVPAATPTKQAPPATTAPTKATAAPTQAAVPTTAAVKPLSPPVLVKTGSSGAITEAPDDIASEKGYFTDEGLNVQFVNFAGGAAQETGPLGTGELDIGVGGASAGVFNAMARDIPIKIVADNNMARPGQSTLAFMVRKDLADTIKDYKDLKGKTIAINAPGNPIERMMETALAKGGNSAQRCECGEPGLPGYAASIW